MKVYLLKDLNGKGKKGDVVSVSDGYAKNFLIPKQIAAVATKSVLAQKKTQDEAAKYHKEQQLLEAKKTAEFLKDKTVVVKAKAGEGEKLFGSVTSKDIAQEIEKNYGIKVEKRKIEAKEIKHFGEFSVKIKLAVGVVTNLKVLVEKK